MNYHQLKKSTLRGEDMHASLAFQCKYRKRVTTNIKIEKHPTPCTVQTISDLRFFLVHCNLICEAKKSRLLWPIDLNEIEIPSPILLAIAIRASVDTRGETFQAFNVQLRLQD